MAQLRIEPWASGAVARLSARCGFGPVVVIKRPSIAAKNYISLEKKIYYEKIIDIL
jgi:hypothetical protein